MIPRGVFLEIALLIPSSFLAAVHSFPVERFACKHFTVCICPFSLCSLV